MLRFWYKKKKDSFVLELEKFLGFEINNTELYREAFAHPSAQLPYNYQRLEFLGDAVLSLVVAEYLFKKYKKLSEGDLSKYRTKLVNKQILKEIALQLKLDRWIKHQLLPEALEKSSIYCDTVESFIGAIYLDKGKEFAEKFINDKILKQLDEVKDIEDIDYKSKIIQIAQKYKWNLRFNVEKVEKRNNDHIFYIGLYINQEKIAEAHHYNKKQAQQLASKIGLEKLNLL